jgi:hypothetical protein
MPTRPRYRLRGSWMAPRPVSPGQLTRFPPARTRELRDHRLQRDGGRILDGRLDRLGARRRRRAAQRSLRARNRHGGQPAAFLSSRRRNEHDRNCEGFGRRRPASRQHCDERQHCQSVQRLDRDGRRHNLNGLRVLFGQPRSQWPAAHHGRRELRILRYGRNRRPASKASPWATRSSSY